MSGLWTCVAGLNDSVINHGSILGFIQKNQDDIHSRMKNLNSSLNQVLKDLQSFSENDLTGELDKFCFCFPLSSKSLILLQWQKSLWFLEFSNKEGVAEPTAFKVLSFGTS